ncbi:hypothetical protein EMCG_07024 [[Emmonsia] crescens]|uniref:Uncharacterized protein n=1 Tax=[Emmonsia] crescens TaxID=73230 RepID=A0A0G2I9G7_9EURO|nr:hypothetical protein EMCG_07024 [Emmonsia crescens UAMH 3008]
MSNLGIFYTELACHDLKITPSCRGGTASQPDFDTAQTSCQRLDLRKVNGMLVINLQELIEIRLQHVGSTDNRVDGFIKPFAKPAYIDFIEKIGLEEIGKD